MERGSIESSDKIPFKPFGRFSKTTQPRVCETPAARSFRKRVSSPAKLSPIQAPASFFVQGELPF